MTAPSAIIGPLPASGHPSAIVRRPVLTVTWGPNNSSQTTMTNVVRAKCSLGLDLAVGEATFTVKQASDLNGAGYWSQVRITTSAPQVYPTTTAGHAQTWMGRIVEFDYTMYPREIAVICRGYLVQADRQKNPVAGGTALTTLLGGTGADEDIVTALLAASGIIDPGGGNPPTLNIDGTAQILGQIATEPYRWAEKESALAYIQRLDQASCYRTYDDAGGTIYRLQVTTVPGGSAVATFTEGVDIASGTGQQSILTAANKIVVTGYDPGDGTGPVTDEKHAANAYIPNPPQYIVDELSSPLIEYALDSDRPVGQGLSCESAATFLLAQFNQTQVSTPFVTPRDDALLIGTTIDVESARLGSTGHYLVQHVDRGIDERGNFTQTITALSGAS